MIAYKAFAPGLKCKDYQFQQGKNVTEQANCRRNGFHAAENPLDCLSYYQWNGLNEFWIVMAAGDIDEDGNDSKISCTEMTPLVRLDEKGFLTAAVGYMMQHPGRGKEMHLNSGPFRVRRNERPSAEARKGEWLLLVEEMAGVVTDYEIGQAQSNKRYTINLLREEKCENEKG